MTLGEKGALLDEDESIRRHLRRLLTTRQGAVQALPDYGLPDLNDLTLSRSELTQTCCRAIEYCIMRYEPRLTLPVVQPLPGSEKAPFTMIFSIAASKVEGDGRLSPWRWTVTMNGEKILEER
jgi:type VI secretion system protein